MNLVLLCHPNSIGSASMPRYARMIGEGMKQRGHEVAYWTAPEFFWKLPVKSGGLKKWLGYLDSYLLFPVLLKLHQRKLPPNTLFVVTDHALGMWVPAVAKHPHVIHCHDFLAQRSSVGEISENPTGFTGKIYQKLIRRGYQCGRYFISISQKTKADLERFLIRPPAVSEVVHNGLNFPFKPLLFDEAINRLKSFKQIPWEDGYFLHVGGNQWYKNRTGVLQLYNEYLKMVNQGIPLVMVGTPPDRELIELAKQTPANGSLHFVSGLSDEAVHAAYAAATALIFPSLEEGFGWPIIEAQASGCPVITTGLAPMTEVGGKAAWYIPRRHSLDKVAAAGWAQEGAVLLKNISLLSVKERTDLVAAGIANARRFTTESALDSFEAIYKTILNLECGLENNTRAQRDLIKIQS